MKKALLVYNPLSGNRNVPKKLDYIISRFMMKDILVVPFRIDGDCNEKLSQLLLEGDYSFVAVSGGDGTVNTIVEIVLSKGIDMPIGVIPSGTCNDFARSLDIPADLEKCLDIILDGNIVSIDAGIINNEKYTLNTCAGGNFVDVSFSTNSELKKSLGPLAYYVTALGEFTNTKPVKLKVTTENETVEGEFLLFLILNGKHAAGFTNILGMADLSDGYMDILLIKKCLHIEMAGLFFRILNNDDITSDKNVICLRCKECSIEGDEDFSLSVDGEEWGKLPINVKYIHNVLKVFVK